MASACSTSPHFQPAARAEKRPASFSAGVAVCPFPSLVPPPQTDLANYVVVGNGRTTLERNQVYSLLHFDNRAGIRFVVLFCITLLAVAASNDSTAQTTDGLTKTQAGPNHWQYSRDGEIVREEWDRDKNGTIDCVGEHLIGQDGQEVVILRFDTDGDGKFGTSTDETIHRYTRKEENVVSEHDVDSDGTIDFVIDREPQWKVFGKSRNEVVRSLLATYISEEAVYVSTKSEPAEEFQGNKREDYLCLDRLAGNTIHVDMTFENDSGNPSEITLLGNGMSYITIIDRDTNGVPEEYRFQKKGYRVSGWVPRVERDTNQDGLIDGVDLLDESGRVLIPARTIEDVSGLFPSQVESRPAPSPTHGALEAQEKNVPERRPKSSSVNFSLLVVPDAGAMTSTPFFFASSTFSSLP